MVIKYSIHRCKREVRKMLMVNSIELIPFNQVQQMREFHRYQSVLFQEYLHARNKVIDVRNMGQNIIADQQVSLAIQLDQFLSCLPTKKLYFRPDPFFNGNLSDVRRGLNP